MLMAAKPVISQSAEEIARAVIEKTGGEIVLALPLGLGKAVHIANALVKAAVADPEIKLTIFTALTLEAPRSDSELMRRFLNPAKKRLFGDYPEFEYAKRLRAGTLPENIEVNEFFLMAGQWTQNKTMQRHYIATNYTHALKYLLDRKVNVIAPLVAPPDEENAGAYSTSSNPDIIMDLIKARDAGKADFIVAGEVNENLPYMTGEATLAAEEFEFLLDSPEPHFELYTAPKRPVDFTDMAIGLHVARLIRDGGTLQIGIGAIGDAVAKALILRHKDNKKFRAAVFGLNFDQAADLYNDAPFETGVHGISEMFVDGFLRLAQEGVLSREVDGALLSAAFFVDCRDFYERLNEMPAAQRQKFKMVPVSYTNELFGDEEKKRKERVSARFVNSAMMATLDGAVVSDALEDGRVISGVGGQYNFVAQAFALEDARAIITLESTRDAGEQIKSNILWRYGHTTIPWHLRDIIVTEYGVADLRGKTDEDVVKAMLNIADSRFQDELMVQAKKAGKLSTDYEIPIEYRNNRPERLKDVLEPLREDGTLPLFPFGTDFTDEEIRLLPALKYLKAHGRSKGTFLKMLWLGMSGEKPTGRQQACLERMKLNKVRSFKAFIYKALLLEALRRTHNKSAQ